MKSVPEGSVFAVHWADIDREPGKPGLLVVARRAPRTAVIAAYVYQVAPDAALSGGEFALPEPSEAVARGKMSALPMVTGEWPTLGVHPDFRREEWPFREVAWWDRREGGQWMALELDDKNPLQQIGQRDISAAEAATLPSDDLESTSWPAWLLRRLDDERRARELDEPWSHLDR